MNASPSSVRPPGNSASIAAHLSTSEYLLKFRIPLTEFGVSNQSPKKGWLKMLKNRMLSFSVIVSLGFILVVSLGVTAFLDLFSNHLKSMFPDTTVVIFYILNQVITVIGVTAIFAVVFKVLPDAKIRWKDVFAGAFVSAVLFMLGKFAISFYISKASIVTLMVLQARWLFY